MAKCVALSAVGCVVRNAGSRERSGERLPEGAEPGFTQGRRKRVRATVSGYRRDRWHTLTCESL